MKTALFALMLLPLTVQPAQAQSWSGTDWRSPRGLHSASISVQKNEFGLAINCDETAQVTRILRLLFSGPALPRLYGRDGQEETLLLSFDEGAHTREWQVYYFDGGLGDQAWIGELGSTDEALSALANAQTVSILNTDRELIYVFPAKGTSAGVQLLRETCGLGANW
ncbi:hypothetical protein [Pseudophaeobacter sp.]|uniref:hypothetical protein n=1 Tax=Pseudophaeobacter sp. TaxID=1971739 RepID=UPI003298CADD